MGRVDRPFVCRGRVDRLPADANARHLAGGRLTMPSHRAINRIFSACSLSRSLPGPRDVSKGGCRRRYDPPFGDKGGYSAERADCPESISSRTRRHQRICSRPHERRRADRREGQSPHCSSGDLPKWKNTRRPPRPRPTSCFIPPCSICRGRAGGPLKSASTGRAATPAPLNVEAADRLPRWQSLWPWFTWPFLVVAALRPAPGDCLQSDSAHARTTPRSSTSR